MLRQIGIICSVVDYWHELLGYREAIFQKNCTETSFHWQTAIQQVYAPLWTTESGVMEISIYAMARHQGPKWIMPVHQWGQEKTGRGKWAHYSSVIRQMKAQWITKPDWSNKSFLRTYRKYMTECKMSKNHRLTCEALLTCLDTGPLHGSSSTSIKWGREAFSWGGFQLLHTAALTSPFLHALVLGDRLPNFMWASRCESPYCRWGNRNGKRRDGGAEERWISSN